MTSVSGTPTWPGLITLLLRREDLTLDQARWAMDEIMTGAADPVAVAGFLVALRAKGESVAEVRGLADVMLEHAHRIEVPGETIDIVGTGGDRHNSVNISTMSAVVAAASGLVVVKHGNRAASSASGSADVLEALGVTLTLTPEQVRAVALEAGITFCFAQTFHPAMRHAAPARRGLGVATAFNVLGPMTNPAQPRYAAVGVADATMAPVIAGVFADRGTRAAVFRGDDGLDELTVSTTSTMHWVGDGTVTRVTLDPEGVGLSRHPLEALRGGDAAHNAQVALDLFDGAPGAARDAVLLNAGAAIAVAQARSGDLSPEAVVEAVRAGVATAAATLDSGAARGLLQRWVEASSRVAAATA